MHIETHTHAHIHIMHTHGVKYKSSSICIGMSICEPFIHILHLYLYWNMYTNLYIHKDHTHSYISKEI